MIKLIPFFFGDPAVVQAWLEDQAKQGWFVYECKGVYASFWKEEPKEVRFRLEPSRDDFVRPDLETQAAYRAMGWDYVCPQGKAYHIWRCDDPTVPELNTDPAVQAVSYDYLNRQSRKGYRILIGVWLAILVLLVGMHLFVEDYYIKRVQSWEPAYIWVPMMVCLVLCALVLLLGEWKHRKRLGALCSGVPQPHRKPYRISLWMSWGVLVMAVVIVACHLANLLQPNSWSFWTQTYHEETIPHVVLPELEEIDETRAIHWQNWRTREQWHILQGNWDSDYAMSRYYDFYLPGMAKKLARDLAEQDGLQPLPDTGTEEAWYLEADAYGNQYLLLRQGTRVIEVVYYEGPGDLLDHLGDYVVLLAAE